MSNAPTDAELNEARQQLSGLMVGNFYTQILYVAARLSIPDLLDAAPLTANEIAARTGAHPHALASMLRAMTAMDVLREDDGGRFHLRPMGTLLRSFPGWRSQALLMGEEYFRASGELAHTVMTGELAFERALGSSFYGYLARNSAIAARFHEVMTLTAPVRYRDVPRAFAFDKIGRLYDVGGGFGALTAMLLKAHPHLRALLFDAPRVIDGARRFLSSQGVADRCELTAGDFFENVPAGGDAYLLTSVVVNWNDDRALKLLRNCRAAMTPGTPLIIVDSAFLDGKAPSATAAVIAMAAFALQGSVVRTEAEYRALLAKSNFEITSVRSLEYEPYAMIQAKAV